METRMNQNISGFWRLLFLAMGISLLLPGGSLMAQTFPKPAWFRNNIFTRDFVPSARERSENLIERLTHDGKVTLSESDVIALALENNLDIQVERQNKPAADYDVTRAYGPFDPIFRGVANTDRSTTPSQNFLQSGVFGAVVPIDSLRQNFNFSYLQAFQTGTSAEIDYTNAKNFARSRLPSLNPSIFSTLKFGFTQPLLKNRGVGVNSTPIKVAKNLRHITQEAFSVKVIDVVNQVLNFYWDLVFDREDVNVKQRSLDLAIKTNEDNKRQVEIGTLAPIEVVKSETEVANRRQDLIVAQYTLQQAENTLKRFLSGHRDPASIIANLDPVDTPKPPNPEGIPNVPEAINEAIKNRPELAQARLDLENKNLRYRFTKNQLLPDLLLNGSYQWVGLGGNSAARDSQGNPIFQPDGKPVIIEAGFQAATRQLFTFDFPEYSFGVTLTLPLKNRTAQGDFGRAAYELRQSDARLRLSEQQIALQVRNAHTVLEMNRARIEAATKARQLQERTLDAENKKYQLGASTIRFVLEEQRNLAQAQTNEVRTLVDFTKSLISYKQAQGRLLKDYNIQVEDVIASNEASPKKNPGAVEASLATGSNR